MGEEEKVASLLGFLAPLVSVTRKQNRSLGFRPGRCQIPSPSHPHPPAPADFGSWLGKSFFSAGRREFDCPLSARREACVLLGLNLRTGKDSVPFPHLTREGESRI